MSAAVPIDFYFDFASPYGYFMAEKIDALAARFGRQVRWRPVLLFAVLRQLGLGGPMESVPKRDYLFRDFERSARLLDLPYRRPTRFPVPTQQAARAFYALAAQDEAAAKRFALAVLRAYFCDDQAIDDAAFIAALAAPSTAESIGGDAARAALAQAIDEAAQRQVFGSPFVFIDGEPFFGVDRLPQIEACLRGDGRAALPQEIP